MTIIKRSDLGRPLTWAELDDNFAQVDSLTAAAASAVSGAEASATAAAGSATASATSATSAADSAANAAAALVSAVKSTVTFTTGGTLTSNLDRISDGTYLYYWTGTYPVTVDAGSTVEGTGGIGVGFWAVDTDTLLRTSLTSSATSSGTDMIGVVNVIGESEERTLTNKLSDLVSISDVQGATKDMFDYASADVTGSAAALADKSIYSGAVDVKLPNMGLKAFRYLDGSKDRATLLSLRNQMTPDAAEPDSSISGFTTSASLSNNSERGTAIIYSHMVGQPALLVSTNTTFTANSVTCTDLTDDIVKTIKAKMVIDVVSGTDTYTAYVESISGSTITIEDAWYLQGSDGATTGTPVTGASMTLVPSNKIWNANLISSLNEDSNSEIHVGIELETRNNKSTASGNGYAYDALGGGSYNTGAGFQARGKYLFGFRNYANHSDGASGYGFANTPVNGNTLIGFYDSGSTYGSLLWNNQYGVNIKNPKLFSLIIRDNDNGFITGIDNNGKIQQLKLYHTVTTSGAISSFATVSFVSPSADATAYTMPTQVVGKSLTLRNTSSTYYATMSGSFEGGSGSFNIAPRTSVEFFSDGTYWYPKSASIGQLRTTATYDPPSLATGSQQSTTVSVPGVRLGDVVACSFSLDLSGTRMWAEVTASGVVTVYHRNDTGATVDLSSGTIKVIKLNMN